MSASRTRLLHITDVLLDPQYRSLYESACSDIVTLHRHQGQARVLMTLQHFQPHVRDLVKEQFETHRSSNKSLVDTCTSVSWHKCDPTLLICTTRSTEKDSDPVTYWETVGSLPWERAARETVIGTLGYHTKMGLREADILENDEAPLSEFKEYDLGLVTGAASELITDLMKVVQAEFSGVLARMDERSEYATKPNVRTVLVKSDVAADGDSPALRIRVEISTTGDPTMVSLLFGGRRYFNDETRKGLKKVSE